MIPAASTYELTHRTPRWYLDPQYRRNRAILLATARRCAVCGATGVRLTADHWPTTIAASLATGQRPDHRLSNLRPACLPCNSSRAETRPAPSTTVVGSLAAMYKPQRKRTW